MAGIITIYDELGGEDAPPLAEITENYILLGTFDGMGGAGGTKHPMPGGDYKTSAYLGSRAVREIVYTYISAHMEEFLAPTPETLEQMVQHVYSQLSEYANENNLYSHLKIRGMSFKLLPTTMSVLICHESDDTVDVTCLWAGDSRSYVLQPETGLSQLTVDDLSSPNDAMENLVSDSPMSNNIHLPSIPASTPKFKINCKSYTFKKPCVLFTATDGCFGYLPSPMHLELAFLNTFREGVEQELDIESCGDLLLTKLNPGHDDSTMAVSIFSESPQSLVEVFNARHAYLNELLLPTQNPEIDLLRMQYEEIKQRVSSLQTYLTKDFEYLVSSYLTSAILKKEWVLGEYNGFLKLLSETLDNYSLIQEFVDGDEEVKDIASFYAENYDAISDYICSTLPDISDIPTDDMLSEIYKQYIKSRDSCNSMFERMRKFDYEELVEIVQTIWSSKYKPSYEQYIVSLEEN